MKKQESQTLDYHDLLIKSLKKRSYACKYLNAALEESLSGDKESQQIFLMALRNVAEAQGSITSLAKRVGPKKESVSHLFSSKSNTQLQSFFSLLQTMGFDFLIR